MRLESRKDITTWAIMNFFMDISYRLACLLPRGASSPLFPAHQILEVTPSNIPESESIEVNLQSLFCGVYVDDFGCLVIEAVVFYGQVIIFLMYLYVYGMRFELMVGWTSF